MADQSPPAQRPVTAAALAENERKQQEYAARRRAWTAPWLRRETEREPMPGEGTAEPQEAKAGRSSAPSRPGRGGRGGTVHDKRQGRLEL